MALVLGVNSYATLEEANEYFMDRLDVAAWNTADDSMKAVSYTHLTLPTICSV